MSGRTGGTILALVRTLLISLLFAFALLIPSAVRAEEPSPGPAYKLKLDVDGPTLLLEAGLTVAFIAHPEGPNLQCAPNCNRAQINGFDRWAAGNYSKRWQGIGDYAVAATVLFAPVVVLFDEGFKDGLVDALVIVEAIGGASAAQVMTAFAVIRPRPRAYSTDAPLDERTNSNAGRSFFSGHVADSVASAVAGARTYQRLGRPKMAALVLSAGLAGSAFIGVSRVVAGSHFPSDVLVGGAVGGAFGLLMPAIHDSTVRLTASAPGADVGASVGLVFE